MLDSNNTGLKGILITQSFLLVIAIITIGGNWYSSSQASKADLEKELILNAYTLSDSLQQVNRLKTFCDLGFFSKSTKEVILEKITEGRFSGGEQVNIGEVTEDNSIPQVAGFGKQSFICIGTKRMSRTYHKSAFCPILSRCEGEIKGTIVSKNLVTGLYKSYPCGVCYSSDTLNN